MCKEFFIDKEELYNGITDKTVSKAKEFAVELVKGDGKTVVPLSTSQLRKFFGEVKRQEQKGYNHSYFVMLKPKMAYAVGRAWSSAKKEVTKVRIEDFYNVIVDAIEKVENADAKDKDKVFKNFIHAFEAIVAYHKFEEEKQQNKNKKEQ